MPFSFPAWYTNPMTQVVLLGITCFCTVGMYSALNNIGAGGTQDISLSDTASGVLYGFFALTGLISGGICNGEQCALDVLIDSLKIQRHGTLGYALYVGALWCHQTQGTRWFLIFAGAILGEIMMSYPLEKDKGKAFGIFWAMFQFGTFIGSVIALAINLKSGMLTAVATSTYIAFIIIIFIGVASSFLVLGPHRIVRSDGTLVKVEARATVREEVRGTMRLFLDWRMLALLPMSFASNYFYSYQAAINEGRFDGPTRTLNGTLSAVGSIAGALLIGFFVLDGTRFHRRTRGYMGLGVVTALTIIVWAVGLSWQVTFTRAEATPDNLINYHDADYKGKGALYFFYYFGDATYQALVYWIMSALTNDPFTLARFAGFYKAIQSAGAAGSFGMDAVMTPYLNEHLASWIPMLVSFPFAFLVIRSIKETNYDDEKMVYINDLKNENQNEVSDEKEVGDKNSA
ncbi:MFS general substrate transporter [Hysterangium stoloniferum]|nr:MFS general substrate transporter [Hysterangium stoloniferum]